MTEAQRKFIAQFLKYGLVGGIAFVLDVGVLYACTEYVGLHYVVSATIAFIAGLLCNYLLSVTWVFEERAMSNRTAELLVFSGIGLIGLALNDGLIWLLTERAGFYYIVSKVVAAVVVFLWNFFARRQVLFVKKRNANHT